MRNRRATGRLDWQREQWHQEIEHVIPKLDRRSLMTSPRNGDERSNTVCDVLAYSNYCILISSIATQSVAEAALSEKKSRRYFERVSQPQCVERRRARWHSVTEYRKSCHLDPEVVLDRGRSIRKRKETQRGGNDKGSLPFEPPRVTSLSVC
jgi:hypothetical protein